MMNRSIIRNGAVLAVFALITTAIVALTYAVTKGKISQQIQQQRIQLLSSVLPSSLYDNALYKTCVIINDEQTNAQYKVYTAQQSGETRAFAIETTATDGYSGDIDMIIGVDTANTVLGVRVLKHKETPGLGDKIDLAVSDWILSFNQQRYFEQTASQWKVRKDGGQFDQFTGATITPRAVVNKVAETLQWLAQHQDSLAKQQTQCTIENE